MAAMNSQGPKAEDLAYVRFQAPDLSVMRSFLEDFGLSVVVGENTAGAPTLFSRGSGGSPYIHIVEEGPATFLGLGFKMASKSDLDALAQSDGASDIEEIDAPGGGLRVRFTDGNGFIVDGVFGWEESNLAFTPRRWPLNTIATRARINDPVRLKRGSVSVNRLGHCVLHVTDFRKNESWYKERFGLLTTEEIYDGDESNVIGAFFRCDRGAEPADHHTLFLIGDEKPGFNHAAFEVSDWDAVMLGHDHLSECGYTPHWGVGKHILGSQVFDYWEDPYGNVVEHFSDGDLFDSKQGPAVEPVTSLLGVQWGPLPPARDA